MSRRLLLVLALVASCVIAGQSLWAQKDEPADTFQVNYFSNANVSAVDQTVRVINPGAYAPNFPPNDICAMIYLFDNKQELKECCGCLITADGLLELSMNKDLTANPFDGAKPKNGDIKIVAAAENTTFLGVPCDPTGGGVGGNGKYVLNIVPTPDVRAWSTHYQNDGVVTEDEFNDAALSPAELDSLQEECYGVANVGSGAGICAQGVQNSSEVCN